MYPFEQFSDAVRINHKPENAFPHDIYVERLVDGRWTWYMTYNEMSDDYALTNARACAKRLIERLEKEQ